MPQARTKTDWDSRPLPPNGWRAIRFLIFPLLPVRKPGAKIKSLAGSNNLDAITSANWTYGTSNGAGPGILFTPVPTGLPSAASSLCRKRCGWRSTLIQKVQASASLRAIFAERVRQLESALKIVPDDANLAVVHGNILTALGDSAGARLGISSRVRAAAKSCAGSREAPRGAGSTRQRLRRPECPPLFPPSTRSDTCGAALEDLTAQTLFAGGQLEIIVIDSGSEQNEHAIVEEFQKKFPNIIYQRTEERETVYAAWNRGAKMARGNFLTNANTDDRHRPDALAVMAAYLEEHPEIAVVYADQLVTHFPHETFAETQAEFRWNWPEYSYTELERRCILCSQPVWRRSLHDKYGLFQPDLRSAVDY